MHWIVVLSLIENIVNEIVIGLPGLFSRYNGLLCMADWSNGVPLITHTVGKALLLPVYPQLMLTLLPLQTVVFSGGVIKVTTGYTQLL